MSEKEPKKVEPKAAKAYCLKENGSMKKVASIVPESDVKADDFDRMIKSGSVVLIEE